MDILGKHFPRLVRFSKLVAALWQALVRRMFYLYFRLAFVRRDILRPGKLHNIHSKFINSHQTFHWNWIKTKSKNNLKS